MTRDDAYMLSSVAVDLDITELVDGNVGVHAMCRRTSLLEQKEMTSSRSSINVDEVVRYSISLVLREVMKHFLFVVALPRCLILQFCHWTEK